MLRKQLNHYYTYKDYFELDNNIRCEIINGVIYDMSPAPSSTHQRLLSFLHGEIWNYLKNKPCEVFPAPLDVFLYSGNISDCDTIVQPDITIVCDKNKITEKGCEGAPDFIIEIISPSNKLKDYVTKLHLYSKNSVKEYWIVDPINRTILKYVLMNDAAPVYHTFNDVLKIDILENLVIDFKEFKY